MGHHSMGPTCMGPHSMGPQSIGPQSMRHHSIYVEYGTKLNQTSLQSCLVGGLNWALFMEIVHVNKTNVNVRHWDNILLTWSSLTLHMMSTS